MPTKQSRKSYYDVLNEALQDIAANGFDSIERVAYWTARIRESAEQFMRPPHEMERMLREAMTAIYARMIERGGIAKYHPGIGRFTLERVRPQLRAELDRRIMASASLIRLNREKAVQDTLRRFSGWATSIPKGGSDAVDKAQERRNLKKGLNSLRFDERRVAIDQSAKFTAALSNILATDGGAIALIWHSHWRQPRYKYREDHKERDGKIYLLRESWATQKRFVKPGDAGYYDQVTAVGEEIFCRCFAQYLYSLGQLPDDMLSISGREALAEARHRIKEMTR